MSYRNYDGDRGSFDIRDLVSVQEGAVVSRTLVDRPVATVTAFAFDEGQALSEHSAPYDALVQVVEGELEISIGGESHTVTSGRWLLMPANIPHALEAKEPSVMLLTMIRG
nr:cupin domain-containing protein [uncultured Dethiosulfovibrio sp.]